MKTFLLLEGTKQELDRFCDRMGWKRFEGKDSIGWKMSAVVGPADATIGTIQSAKTSAEPCTLKIKIDTADHASRMVVQAFTAGALESL